LQGKVGGGSFFNERAATLPFGLDLLDWNGFQTRMVRTIVSTDRRWWRWHPSHGVPA
jgi:hypothetical protein